ncbi:hypothetical protein V6N12_061266 [Hibiscus sabdariffa]|uniref:Wall-associated receptor kinase galacturonan-binding domain-containing protein n=1 Tax=Hibiscus sabdariffa TaxID=183260 RepID=A0ABR2DWK1_9ROSI
MGVGVVFYFVLQLPWLIPAVTATGATRSYDRCSNDCDETCGNVPIPHPFGIRSGCYAYNNPWFRVTCNETSTGQKPFIGRINLELVDSYSAGENSVVIVKNPVIYLNCENKRTTSPSSVNLQGSPFFFSSRFNQFGSVGCDNFAAVFPNNQTNPISSCLRKSCGHMASTFHGDGCHAIIFENITSYTASVREVIRPNAAGSQRCTSAFLFSDPSVGVESLRFGRHGCIRSCGNVDIPYPFGIEAGCYMNVWFRVTCNETTDAPKVYLTSFGLQLLRISVSVGTVVVNNPVMYSNCLKANRVGVNRMGRLICANFGTANVSCSSDIPSARSSYAVNMKDIYPNIPSRRLCRSAFVVDQRYLKTIILYRNGTSNWTVSHVPTTLQWCTRIRGWCSCENGPNVFPSVNGQYRGRKLGQNYICVCAVDDDGFVSTDKCQGRSSSCLLHYRYTYMLCLNAPGNKCSSSSCPEGYQYSGDACMPVKKMTEKSKKSHYVAISIGQKPISSSQSKEVVRSLANFFLLSMKGNSLLDIVDPVAQNGGPEEEIVAVAKLAKRCLNLNGKKRPTMKQVALELEWIKSSEEANVIQQSADEDSDTDDMLDFSGITSCSTTGSVLKDTVTLSLDV